MDAVATWIGVITGVSGVTLSFVAIWFAIMVDNRSRQVTDQTIKSLQKIETSVERQSRDTQDLIKAGWDRMLGNTIAGSAVELPTQRENTSALASGIAAELREDLFPRRETEGDDIEGSYVSREDLEEAISRITVAFKSEHPNPSGGTPSAELDRLIGRLHSLDPISFVIARMIITHHLEREHYQKLAGDHRTREAIRELRGTGLLVPLSAQDRDSGPPVYWFPPVESEYINVAFSLAGREEPQAENLAIDALVDAGYFKPFEDGYTVYSNLEEP